MLIAERILKIRYPTEDIDVPIHVYSPKQGNGSSTCRFTIGWPDGEIEMAAGGVDEVQAIDLALKMIGAFLYSSDHHASGSLMWLEKGNGYGFPVSNDLRDMLIGDDKRFF
jgi:hypothetical protein